MLCENCGENEANVKYTQIINGVKKQMNLCEHCAEKLGINNMSFSMPMNMFNFMEDMFSSNLFEPQMSIQKPLLDDIFENEFNTIMPTYRIKPEENKNILDNEMDSLVKKINNERKKDNPKDKIELEKMKLQKRLEKEIKEERYEDAAKTRDEIKKFEK